MKDILQKLKIVSTENIFNLFSKRNYFLFIVEIVCIKGDYKKGDLTIKENFSIKYFKLDGFGI